MSNERVLATVVAFMCLGHFLVFRPAPVGR